MIPGTLGLAAVQVNQLVNVYLATSEGEGAVTYLGFAFRLMYLPIGLFGVLDRHRRHPGHHPPRRRRRHGGRAQRRLAGASHDADAERAGDVRA
jgi:hypothetical protein